jgi:hypothetical protein
LSRLAWHSTTAVKAAVEDAIKRSLWTQYADYGTVRIGRVERPARLLTGRNRWVRTLDVPSSGGRYEVHTRSQELYDKHMAQLARGYLSNGADRSLHNFLRLNFGQLEHRHGRVTGVVVPRPRLLPVAVELLSPELAREVGVGGGGFVMLARFAGNEDAVGYQLDRAADLVGEGARGWGPSPRVSLSRAEAEAFYHAKLGLDKTVWSYPGALFLAAGGYHHHLGTNVWSPGPSAEESEARLLEWELALPTESDVEQTLARQWNVMNFIA